MSIGGAAARLRTSARMLRYRESIGLLPSAGRGSGTHRRYDEQELLAAAYAMRLESRYDVSPKALAFTLRALSDPQVLTDVRELGRLCGRLPSGLAALDFDQQKAQRLLRPRSVAKPRPGRPD